MHKYPLMTLHPLLQQAIDAELEVMKLHVVRCLVENMQNHKTLAEECLDEIEAEHQDAVECRTSVHDTSGNSPLGLEGQSSNPG